MTDEKEIYDNKLKICNHAKRNEKTAWERKRKKLSMLIDEQLAPLEEQERAIILKKIPILDQIELVRQQMVETCIHPYDELVYNSNAQIFTCKFCEARINVSEEV